MITPMVARLVRDPFDREGWFFELKWDRFRAIAETSWNSDLKLYSRRHNDFTLNLKHSGCLVSRYRPRMSVRLSAAQSGPPVLQLEFHRFLPLNALISLALPFPRARLLLRDRAPCSTLTEEFLGWEDGRIEERACTLHSTRADILVLRGRSVKEVVSRVRHECPIAEV